MNFHSHILGFGAKIRIGEKCRMSEHCALKSGFFTIQFEAQILTFWPKSTQMGLKMPKIGPNIDILLLEHTV